MDFGTKVNLLHGYAQQIIDGAQTIISGRAETDAIYKTLTPQEKKIFLKLRKSIQLDKEAEEIFEKL